MQFKVGDRVRYNTIHCTFVGTVDEEHALIFSDNDNHELKTIREIIANNQRIGDIVFLFIRNHYGFYNTNDIFKQKRLLVLPISKLDHHSNICFPIKLPPIPHNELIKKRHAYINLCKRYINMDKPWAVERCQIRILELQYDIEELDRIAELYV